VDRVRVMFMGSVTGCVRVRVRGKGYDLGQLLGLGLGFGQR
jgi:hypothetical protein